MKRSFIREILEAIDEHTISFAGGLPSENLFPIEDLKLVLRRMNLATQTHKHLAS